MNFIITRICSTTEGSLSWRIYPIGNFYKTLLNIKHHDLKDILKQIIDQDPEIIDFIKTLIK